MNTQILNEFDKLVADDASRRWLRERSMMPSQWGISEDLMVFIRGLPIALRVFESPSFVYDCSLYPVVNGGVLYLVFFDAELVTRLGLDHHQAIAVFLHEIGHVADRSTKNSGGEKAADDFAVACGFRTHLAGALERLRDSNVPHCNTTEMAARITQLRIS